ncbi:MAG: hypothetical protein L0229_11840 [Blastocatellia bacterium]|nr:hypothetical protein [Blastocatellia bacterium]
MAKNIKSKNRVAISFGSLDPNELKGVVRDGLVSMTLTDREEFIRTLEAEMRRISLNVRSYLIPLGIPGRTPDDLTPTEVGHLIRYLKINVPNAMPAIEHVLAGYSVFAEKSGQHAGPLAA